jgi:putative ABC transport system permease protein
MLSPRWKKVLADLWANKTRTLLVSLSIAVGVFAVGMITESRTRMLRGLSEDYLSGDPFSGVISTEGPFDEDLLEAIRGVEGVEEADARQSVRVRIKVGEEQWKNLSLDAIRDFDDIRVARMQPEQGEWPPDDEHVAVERSALNPALGTTLELGQEYLIETMDQKERVIKISGVVHNLNLPPALFTGEYTGYITEETLEWLGEERGEYRAVYFRVDREHYFDKEYITAVAKKVRDKVEKSGIEVSEMFIPPDPGESPVASFGLKPIVLILSAVGVLAVFLSGFLVTNTISAVMAQQIRQIGIMKSVGAQSSQIIAMYLLLVLCYGLIALAIGAPLAYVAAAAFADFFATLFNFDAQSYGILPEVIALELFVSLVVPLLASLYSLIRGATITVRDALDSESGSASGYGSNIIDRLINRVRRFPRPVLLSLRNTFRRKGRLLLTLTTLTIAGATFIAVFSVQDSVKLSLNEFFNSLYRYDVSVTMDRNYRSVRLIQEAMQVPGVRYAETWGFINTRRLRDDGTESEAIFFQSPPPDSPLIDPMVLEGRWLRPTDTNNLVVSTGLVKDEDDLAVGDAITLKLKGRETEWHIVGVVKGFGTEMMAYANLPHFERETRDAGVSSDLRVVTTQHDGPFQEEVQTALEEHFRSVGLRVSSSTTLQAEYDLNVDTFNIIIYCLLIMAILTAVVGGLGLAGTMSMNVLERTREIGVMRAIGASDLSVLQVVIVEGLMIGLVSWALGSLFAFPISKLLSDTVGTLFTGSPFTYVYSFNGAVMWLLLSLLIAAFASIFPAWNASRLTVRDVLAYE